MIHRGETRLCAGCPYTGNFVGKLSPSDVKRVYGCTIKFVDNDGMESDSLHNARESSVFTDELSFEEFQARIVQRVAECSGVVRRQSYDRSSEYSWCPALSGDVLRSLIRSVEETIS